MLNFDFTVIEHLFEQEMIVQDVNVEYDLPGVGKLDLKIFDATYFIKVANAFRPYIRGFIMLMILFYHIRQAIGFFGYDAGVVSGRSEHIKSAKENQ